jgi:LysR family nitrogen assimilation transcriptional regulator
VELLVRHGRGVRLTRAGAALVERAEAVIRQLGQIPDQVRDPEQAFAGHVALGLPPAAGLVIAPELVAIFQARWPAASLHIREGVSSSLEEWLLDRRLDIAVLHNPPPLDEIDLAPVLRERMVVVDPPGGDPAPADTPLRFRDLARIPLILPSLPHSNRRLIERAAIRHGTHLKLVLEVDSVPLSKILVRRGFGSTILTYAAVAGEVARGELRARHIERPPLISAVALGVKREARSTWLATEFMPLLRSVIADLVARDVWAGARIVERQQRR